MPLPAASWAAFAAISTVTAPSAVGVKLKVNELSDPEKPLRVLLVTVTSEESNPVTISLNFTVMGIVVALVGDDSLEVMVMVGAVLS